MISEEQLATWEKLANEATEGAWYQCKDRVCDRGPWHECSETDCYVFPIVKGNRKFDANGNARFIAAAREAVPALIAEVRRLEKEADWLADRETGCPPKRRKENTCPLLECKDCWRDSAWRAVSNE